MPSSLSRYSSAPKTKRIFWMLWCIFEGHTNRSRTSQPFLKNCQIGTFESMHVIQSFFGANYFFWCILTEFWCIVKMGVANASGHLICTYMIFLFFTQWQSKPWYPRWYFYQGMVISDVKFPGKEYKIRYVTFHEKQECWYALPLVLKNHSDTSAEAHMARGCDGKPYPHECCSWKIIP